MNWMEGLVERERGCRRGGNGGLNLYSSLFSISRTCRKLHGQLWIILQAAVLVCKCPYYNVTCICVHAYVICHGSSFKPASLMQDILVSNASKLDSQSVIHICENRLHVRSLKPCITVPNTATYARILLSPILGCAMEITLASAVRDPTPSLQVCSSVRPFAGGQPWLIEQQRSEWWSIIQLDSSPRHVTHGHRPSFCDIALYQRWKSAEEMRGNLDLQSSASSVSTSFIIMITKSLLYQFIPF